MNKQQDWKETLKGAQDQTTVYTDKEDPRKKKREIRRRYMQRKLKKAVNDYINSTNQIRYKIIMEIRKTFGYD